MTAPVLPDAVTDPAGFVAAVADLREGRANSVAEPRWLTVGSDWIVAKTNGCTCGSSGEIAALYGHEPGCGLEPVLQVGSPKEAEHIAAEANPAHALAEVAVWRGVAGRHVINVILHDEDYLTGAARVSRSCRCHRRWPCPDLLAVVAACQAYVASAS